MDSDGLYWDPYDARFAADPWPLFNRMREEAPLYYNEPHDFYAVSRYADVERVLTDTAAYSSARGVMLELIKLNMEIPPGTLIMEDPPIHNIHRQLLARVFSPRGPAAQARRSGAARTPGRAAAGGCCGSAGPP